MSLALRPGARVVRLDGEWLAVVLGSERCALRDSPAVRRALAAWGRCESVPEEVPDAEAALRDRGWLLPAGLVRGLPAPGDPSYPAEAAALAALGEDATAAALAKAETPVALTCSDRWRTTATDVLTEAGLALADDGDVRLVVGHGEPDREAAARLVADGQPHLWLTVLPAEVRIGPFVEPGRTACLACVDAALGESDSWQTRVAAQLGATAPLETCDPVLWRMGLAWACGDLVSWVTGDLPATWSATITVDRSLRPRRREWLRHPHCGCGWDELFAASC